ncbi:MAG: metallophosphoesterase [Clostridia bacterium]|nr:metallophosphoesterase [Clostridia bacterium]
MIYITGDTHSDFTRLADDQFPIQTEMTKNDYVIICGDFGGVWTFEEESNREKYILDWLNNKNFTTLFVDGNHENFTRLYNDYPVEECHGGKVHKIRDSVLHLMRGEIFDIDGKKIFAFGGAKSHDIQDGILNLDDKKWYFGHYHDYRQVNSQFVLLYEGIIPLEFENNF